MSNALEVSVKLINEKIKFEGKAGDLPPIITDYIPPLGEGEGYMSLQLFLISLASCLGGTIALLLRRMGKHVKSLGIDAQGTRREQHPTGFEKIELKIFLVSEDVEDEDLKKAVQMSEQTFCPVLSMIKNNVDIMIEYEIAHETVNG